MILTICVFAQEEKISQAKIAINVVFLICFCVCSKNSMVNTSPLVYILNLNYGIFQLNQTISFIHIESGIIMIIISIFHIFWHLIYYKNLFK